MTNEHWLGINFKDSNPTIRDNIFIFDLHPPEKPFKPIKYRNPI